MKHTSFAFAAVTLLGSGLASPSGVLAQDAEREWTRFVPRVSAAGAFDARHNGSDPEMYLGLMSLEWGTRVPGLALRLDGIYAKRDWTTRITPGCEPNCGPETSSISFLGSKVTAAGVMLGASYQLFELGGFRPYILGGAGMLRSHDKYVTGTRRPIAPCPTEQCAYIMIGYPATERNDRPLTAAAQIGGGMAYSLPWFSLFAEARYLSVGYANPRGLRGATPVSLGVKF